jgi:hypothetical protein
VATDNDEIPNVATPAPFNGPVPSTVAPSLNVTVPVGAPLPGATAATVAVNVTDWPNTDGLAEDVSVVTLEALLTTCDTAGEVLVAKLPSVAYTAVTLCGLPATDSAVVLKVATPEPFRVPGPNVVAPSLNVTVPVGVPAPGATAVTVAVKVTDWPNTDGFGDAVSAVAVLAAPTVCVIAAEVLPLKLVSVP